jgi:hypothetical protein
MPRHKQVLREVLDLTDLCPPAPPQTVPLDIKENDLYFAQTNTAPTGSQQVDATMQEFYRVMKSNDNIFVLGTEVSNSFFQVLI